jgi:hypothetical protein
MSREYGAGTPMLLGRTPDGRMITAADLNNNILMCQDDLKLVLEVVESLRGHEYGSPQRSASQAGSNGGAPGMNSCCTVS